MSTTQAYRIYKLTALTDIWTGNAQGQPDRVITTGLLGSIRWWFEIVVRGIGGSACDPTNSQCQDRNHCVVCELFGCTGWARKFRFDVLNAEGKPRKCQIKANQEFQFRFIPFRWIEAEEWALLDLTLRLIAEYGAIGGKTVYKPSDEVEPDKVVYHQDYGLVRIESGPDIVPAGINLKGFVKDSRWHQVGLKDFGWASLTNFWCVKGQYLARKSATKSTFNYVIGRNENKNGAQRLLQNNNANQWLAGRQQESKKVFSFKNPECAQRTFGFIKPGTVNFKDINQRLQAVGFNLNNDNFLTGDKILQRLLTEGGMS